MNSSSRSESRGQVLALFALFLVVLIGATAVTVDYGTWLKSRRDYQNVADAAVLAGGGFLSRPIDATKREHARRAAWDSLNAQLNLNIQPADLDTLDNSDTPEGTPWLADGYRLWVSTPPIGAAAKYPGIFRGGNDRYLFAWVEKDNASFFSRIFGQGERTVSAWATAGVFPAQYAVITLRQNGQGPVSAPSDIDLDGNGTVLKVNDGDVGGNWGMKLTAASSLWLTGDADAYLVDYLSCGNSCWSPNQVSSGPLSFTVEAPQQLPNIIDDPAYPLPSVLTGVPATGGTAAVPKAIGTEIGPPPSAFGDVSITKGTILGAGCSADSPRIGPGWYDDIDVSGCLILDPVHNYADPNDADDDGDFVETDVPQGQQAGIFYITGTLNVNNNSLVVGDGISLVLRETSNQPALQVNGDGAVDINTGVTGVNRKKAAFKTDGSYSYTFNTTLNVWEYTANNLDKSTVGVAVYAVKPDQTGNTTPDASTNLIKVAAGAALAWQGILYAPRDNIVLSGQPSHDDIGQFICWTVKIAGGTTINQTYDGPGEAAPRLVEPRLGQ
jgi:Putative Flp pilus-assembly TadE/G-like